MEHPRNAELKISSKSVDRENQIFHYRKNKKMLIPNINKAVIEDFKMKSKGVILISTNLDIRNIKAIFNKMIEFELLDYSRISYVKQFKIEKKKCWLLIQLIL